MLTKLTLHDPKWVHGLKGPPALAETDAGIARTSLEMHDAHQRDRFVLDWKRAALTSLSLLAGATGAAAATPEIHTSVSLPGQEIDLQATHSAEELKESIRQSFGRAPRSRKEAYRRLDSLKSKGALDASDSEGRTLVDHLYLLNTQPLAPKVKRRQLMLSVLRQLDNPELMGQGRRGTCASAGLQHVLASRDPIGYVRIVGGLLSPEGQVSLAGGATLSRVEHSIRDDSERDVVSRVLQSALVDYGNGPEVYSNKDDRSTGPHLEELHQANPWVPDSGHIEGGHSGLYPAEITRVLDALFPGEAETHFVDPELASQHLENIVESMGQGKIVLAGLKWDEGAHLVVVKEASNGQIVAWNPWGESGRQAPDSIDDWGIGFSPMMAPVRTSGPEREDLNKTGRFRMSQETFLKHLLVYETGG